MIQTCTMIFKIYLREKNLLYELERKLLTKRFINILNVDNAAKFFKIFDIILSGYGRLETDSNICLLNL